MRLSVHGLHCLSSMCTLSKTSINFEHVQSEGRSRSVRSLRRACSSLLQTLASFFTGCSCFCASCRCYKRVGQLTRD